MKRSCALLNSDVQEKRGVGECGGQCFPLGKEGGKSVGFPTRADDVAGTLHCLDLRRLISREFKEMH